MAKLEYGWSAAETTGTIQAATRIGKPLIWRVNEVVEHGHPMDIEIAYLADQPWHIPTLAAWHFAQWSYFHPGQIVQDRIDEFQDHLGGQQVPTTLVATENGHLLGSASLLAHDLPPRTDLTPWLASVYVDPPHRGRGVASALVRHVVEEAAALGYERLYLFTPDAAPLYARLGWSEFDRMQYHGESITLMQYVLGED